MGEEGEDEGDVEGGDLLQEEYDEELLGFPHCPPSLGLGRRGDGLPKQRSRSSKTDAADREEHHERKEQLSKAK